MQHFAQLRADRGPRAERWATAAWRAFGRTVQAGAFPIGIDVDEFAAPGRSAGSAARCTRRMRREYSRRKLLVGVDRLDYSKGLPQRMRAFRELLQRLPREPHGSATLIQIASPSARRRRAPTPTSCTSWKACAASINGDYGELDWMPVRYIHRTVARTRLPGLYRASRVGLVTPLRDGMNLVAKEFLAAQDPAGSRRAGAVALCRRGRAVAAKRCWSIPTTRRHGRRDPAGTADAGGGAADPAPGADVDHQEYDVHWWCDSFLDTLSKAMAEETGTPWLRL